MNEEVKHTPLSIAVRLVTLNEDDLFDLAEYLKSLGEIRRAGGDPEEESYCHKAIVELFEDVAKASPK